jgi:hypothetical protein
MRPGDRTSARSSRPRGRVDHAAVLDQDLHAARRRWERPGGAGSPR